MTTTPPGSAAARRALSRSEAIRGVLFGTAVGDSLGLPMEGLKRARLQKLFNLPWRQRLLGPWGMVSDDTEHTVMVAQALLSSGDDVASFQQSLAWKLRWWLVSLPAGVGFATLRATLKLWLGSPPSRSGVRSAGNGPAMRSALFGALFADDRVRMTAFVRASTEITHRDARAVVAALAVAETTAWMTRETNDVPALLTELCALGDDPEWSVLLDRMSHALQGEESVACFADTIGAAIAVSGYAYQSVPVAIYAALRHRDDFETAVTEAIACGGDTDTVAAITGAIVGARVGVAAIPVRWINGLCDWPRSKVLLRAIADRLSAWTPGTTPPGCVRYFWPAIPFRNLFFLAVVLAYGFRRLLPPY